MPNSPADVLAFRAARDVCRRYGKEYYFATAFLPRAKRDAAHAVYAFGRMIRDAVEIPDEELQGAAAMRHQPLGIGASGACCSSHPLDQRVGLFRERLDEIYEGRLELPAPDARSEAQHVLHAIGIAARRFEIPRQSFVELAESVRTDQLVSRYATWASLDRYCRQSGGAAALAAGCVLGFTHSGASEHAMKLGVAIRLTQMLRDVGGDWARGRVYLPLEDLARFRYGERDLAAGVANDNFRSLIRFEIARARQLYREAAEGLCWVAGDGSRLAAATVTAQWSGILDVIERQGYDVFSSPARLTAGQRFRRLPLAWRLARRRSDTMLPGGLLASH